MNNTFIVFHVVHVANLKAICQVLCCIPYKEFCYPEIVEPYSQKCLTQCWLVNKHIENISVNWQNISESSKHKSFPGMKGSYAIGNKICASQWAKNRYQGLVYVIELLNYENTFLYIYIHTCFLHWEQQKSWYLLYGWITEGESCLGFWDIVTSKLHSWMLSCE